MEIVILTGMSGAGKTQALKYFEDNRYYAIDNLPAPLLANVVDLAYLDSSKLGRLAVGMDIRGGSEFEYLLAQVEGLESIPYTIIFLDASDEVLLKRFSETRRIHPLESRGLGVSGLIEEERRLLRPLRERADVVVDTSGLTVRELREKLGDIVPSSDEDRKTRISITSFGYKYGHPLDADIVFDVRFMPNPFWVPELRDRRGSDPKVKEFVLGHEEVREFIRRFKELIDLILPGYQVERRPYLSIGIGCTGGRHRSVVIANELARLFRKSGQNATVTHRDLKK
jgi:UPF0042 nucleotide-binding protein